MIASKSNVANQATVTATPASALQDINVITDGDYSSVYTDALSGSVVIEFVFASPVNIDYVAIGGSNVARKTSVQIDLSQSATGTPVGATITDPLNLSESSVLMYEIQSTSVLKATVTVTGGGDLSLAEIAIGEKYEIPKGEQGGYNRPWTVPNIEARSTTGLDGSPVNLSYESRALKCTLSVPNNIMVDFAGWYEFIDFAATNTFYILEDGERTHSYACFNAKPTMTSSHAQAGKELGNSAISFNAFAKSTEALF